MEAAAPHGMPLEGGSRGKPEGRYANYFEVGHNAFEFLFDFGQLYGAGAADVHTRIVTGPPYAKAFLATLQVALERYERTHGPIASGEEES